MIDMTKRNRIVMFAAALLAVFVIASVILMTLSSSGQGLSDLGTVVFMIVIILAGILSVPAI